MIAVGLLMVLVVLAVPTFQSMIRTSRTVTLTNELVTALSLARSEAVKRGMEVSVCASSNHTSCTGSWTDGWMVWADEDADSNVDADEIIRVFTPSKGTPSLSALSNSAAITAVSFLPLGQLGLAHPAVFQVWLDGCSGQEKRQIDISLGGRLNTSRVSCS